MQRFDFSAVSMLDFFFYPPFIDLQQGAEGTTTTLATVFHSRLSGTHLFATSNLFTMRASIITLTVLSLVLHVAASAAKPPVLPDLLYFGTQRDMKTIHSDGGLLPGDVLAGHARYLYLMFRDEPEFKLSTVLAARDGHTYTVMTRNWTSSFKPLDDEGRSWEATEKIPFLAVVGREEFRKGHIPIYYDIFDWQWDQNENKAA